jgi:hypothetical protein
MNKVLGRVKHAWRVLSGQVSAGKAATIFPEDVLLVSYPKSGNTWVRFLIANLVHSSQPVSFLNIESVIPSIYILPDRKLRRFPSPRILKSHECYMPRYRRVIYIVRDPRDVAVSYYYYNIKKRLLAENCTLDQYIPKFIADELDMKSGPWGEHVLSWVRMQDTLDQFLLMRYEDIIANPQVELHRVAEFLNLRRDSEQIARAIELSSAKKMRGMEEEQSDRWVFTKGMRKDIPFIRSATAGGWRNNLSPGAVLQIESAWGRAMRAVGYPFAGMVHESNASDAQQAPVSN